MRNMTIRGLLFRVDLASNVLSCCVLLICAAAGWLTPFYWWHALIIAGGWLLIAVALRQLICTPLLFAPLQALMRMLRSKEPAFISPSAGGVAELHEAAALCTEMIESAQSLTRQSEHILQTGTVSKSLPTDPNHPFQKAFLRIVDALTMLEHLFDTMSNGDLGVQIPEALLRMKVGKAFGKMKAEIREITLRVRQEVLNISKASAEIAALSQQGAQNAHTETESVENISSSIHKMADNLREVMQNIMLQADSVEKTFADIENMVHSIEEVNNSVELLSSSADSTARSIDDIHKFMQHIQQHAHSLAQISETISKEAHDGVTSVGEVIDGIRTIKETVEDAAATIQRLGRESDRIGEILEVINGVAEQTNLLALNASIIAAQAGTHGRGFSVVADEIKELAGRTRASTKEISAIIRSLQNGAAQGIAAMSNSLQAVEIGVSLSNAAGGILKKIMESIQEAREMATTLAEATVKQTQNSQQVAIATERITQKLDGLHDTAVVQSRGSAHLAEMASILKDATQHIEQSVTTQLQIMDPIVVSIEAIQGLVKRNADIAHYLASSSEQLEILGSNLSEHMGHFLTSSPSLPADFQESRPTVAFLYPGAPSFYGMIYRGISREAGSRVQTLELDCHNDSVLQAEYIYWLQRQSWFSGLLITPFDEHTGGRIVAEMLRKKTPVIVIDRPANRSPLTVMSDNTKGGIAAAELMRTVVPDNSLVFACGPRNIHSLFHRMQGFAEQGKQYKWEVFYAFTSLMNIEEAKEGILSAYRRYQGVKGIFVTNEHASLAIIELLKERTIPDSIHIVTYDINTEIVEAIRRGLLCGTIFQDPERIGRMAMQEFFALQAQGATQSVSSPRVVLAPVKKITKDNLSTVTFE